MIHTLSFVGKHAANTSTLPTIVVKHRPSSIVQRAASLKEVANLVVYVAPPQASATTGAALRGDGRRRAPVILTVGLSLLALGRTYPGGRLRYPPSFSNALDSVPCRIRGCLV